jgi:prepilin-type N-terminal cleavage/methylation domain-containing protein
MIKHADTRGFTLIELLIVMAVMGLVLAAASDTFVTLLRGYKTQSKIAETNIEGIIGLELMRQDIERAGFGLPWGPLTMPAYSEASQATASKYNDSPNNPPRPILNGADGWVDPSQVFSNSDYLVIKATNVAGNDTSQLWTYMTTSGINVWDTSPGPPETPADGDYVIVLSPGTGSNDARNLLSSGQMPVALPNSSDPQPQLIFAIAPSDLGTVPRMPFNRSDYYITTTSVDVPQRCAPNTGVLMKATVGLKAADGQLRNYLPLLDCVADMKVLFRLDTDGDGTIDTDTGILKDPSGVDLSAQDIRKQVKEIRVYILAHEGQMDKSFTYPAATIRVGDRGVEHMYNLGANIHYRWKLYTIVVQPKNMRQRYDDNG